MLWLSDPYHSEMAMSPTAAAVQQGQLEPPGHKTENRPGLRHDPPAHTRCVPAHLRGPHQTAADVNTVRRERAHHLRVEHRSLCRMKLVWRPASGRGWGQVQSDPSHRRGVGRGSASERAPGAFSLPFYAT